MTLVLIVTSSQQAKSGGLQRKWRHQKQLCSTSSKLQVTPKWLKSMWWDTSRQTSHPPNTRRKLSSQDHPVTSDIQVSNNKYHHTRGRLIPNKLIQLDRCSKCGDSRHVEGLMCPDKKYQCKSYHKYGHLTSLCLKTCTFQTKSTQSTPTTSWRGVHTRWFHMWPVKRIDLQQWVLLFTSENPMCTS